MRPRAFAKTSVVDTLGRAARKFRRGFVASQLHTNSAEIAANSSQIGERLAESALHQAPCPQRLVAERSRQVKQDQTPHSSDAGPQS